MDGNNSFLCASQGCGVHYAVFCPNIAHSNLTNSAGKTQTSYPGHEGGEKSGRVSAVAHVQTTPRSQGTNLVPSVVPRPIPRLAVMLGGNLGMRRNS